MDGRTRLNTSDFDYDLPPELIAQTPIEPRDHSRLMVVRRADGRIRHARFYDLPEYLGQGDLLVFNDSRVIPARLYGTSVPSGARIELLLLERQGDGSWRSLVKPGRRMREGAEFEIEGAGRTVTGRVASVNDDGSRDVSLSDEDHLAEMGIVPLPPYIHEPLADPERYQTVYSRVAGSVAAPTAGLHFTPGLLDRVQEAGAELAFVTLHVGWDSFRPVALEDIASHEMHSEYWQIGPGGCGRDQQGQGRGPPGHIRGHDGGEAPGARGRAPRRLGRKCAGAGIGQGGPVHIPRL